MEAALSLMMLNGVINLVSFVFGLVMYILISVGMYTIAKRRGIRNPWLAWIPVGNVWILGSISDQYQFSAKGKKTNRRKVLLGIQIAMMVIALILVVLMIMMILQLALLPEYATYPDMQLASYGYDFDYGYEEFYDAEAVNVLLMGFVILAAALVVIVVSIVQTVFTYISMYDLFASCSPSNATAYLVLSIFFSFLSNIFVFVCRNKDEGMRPVYQQIPAWQYPPQGYQQNVNQNGYYQPQPGNQNGYYPPQGYQPPVSYQPPVQPQPIQPEPPAQPPEDNI